MVVKRENNLSLHLLNMWVQNTEEGDIVMTLVHLCILYPAKFLAPTIADLIGIQYEVVANQLQQSKRLLQS